MISHNFCVKMVRVNFWNFHTVHSRIFSDKAHVETVSSGTRWKIFGCNLKKAQRLLLLTLSKTVLVLLWFVCNYNQNKTETVLEDFAIFSWNQFCYNFAHFDEKNQKLITAQRNNLISRKEKQIQILAYHELQIHENIFIKFNWQH